MTITNIKLIKKEEGKGLRFYIETKGKKQILILLIPEERIYSEDLEFGIAHEITEATLREVILSMIEEGLLSTIKEGFLFPSWILHEMTILSLPKYPLIKRQYEEAESLFNIMLPWKTTRLSQ